MWENLNCHILFFLILFLFKLKFPDQGLNPHPLQWKCRVCQGSSLPCTLDGNVKWYSYFGKQWQFQPVLNKKSPCNFTILHIYLSDMKPYTYTHHRKRKSNYMMWWGGKLHDMMEVEIILQYTCIKSTHHTS